MSRAPASTRSIRRRTFLKQAAASVICALPRHRSCAIPSALHTDGDHTPLIKQAYLDLNNLRKWDESRGDSWDPFWADDDNLYAFNCDGRGFGTQNKNLALNQLVGSSPARLHGTLINSMDAYGRENQKRQDGATWKACGQECIDSIFYAFVSRNTYGFESGDPLTRQTARNSSLIKSMDRGLTWTREEDDNYRLPMWPGSSFGAPFFIHYGRNGGSVARDSADRYVYAISTNGFWNDGDAYVLGRVERTKLPLLDASMWTYFAGGDGSSSVSWVSRLEDARPILSLPARCGQGPACYIPALGSYVMIAWYNTTPLKKWFEPVQMKYDFYQAPHPWGPWTFIDAATDDFLVEGHMYGPSLCAKFQQSTATQVSVSMFTSGCPFDDVPRSLYKMWQIPLILDSTPPPAFTSIFADDPELVYKGIWQAPGASTPGGNVRSRATSNSGDSVSLTFLGSGVACLANKYKDYGDFDVFLDGELKTHVNLRTENLPCLRSIQVFAVRDLPLRIHTLKVTTRSAAYVSIERFNLFGKEAKVISRS